MSNIAKVEVLPIAMPVDSSGECDGSVDTVVVRVTDEDGLTGIGECDAPPSVVKAFIEMPSAHIWSQNSIDLLIGRDPFEIKGIWEKLYDATQYPGRRGLGIRVNPDFIAVENTADPAVAISHAADRTDNAPRAIRRDVLLLGRAVVRLHRSCARAAHLARAAASKDRQAKIWKPRNSKITKRSQT